MATTREKLRKGSRVWVRGTVNRTTSEAVQGIDSVLVWVDNPNDARPGHRQHNIVVAPNDVVADEDVAYLPDFTGEDLDQLTSVDDPAIAEGLLRRLLETYPGAETSGFPPTTFAYENGRITVGYGTDVDDLSLTTEEQALLDRLTGADTINDPDA